MLTQLYNDFMFFLQVVAIIMIGIIAIIIMPYILRYVISKIHNIKTRVGYIKSNKKEKNINFDEFDNIEEIRIEEKKNKQEIQYEYEVLKQAYNESIDKRYNKSNKSLSITDLMDACESVAEAKKELHDFRILDSVEIKDKKHPEGKHIINIKNNHKNFDVELFKNWSMQIFKIIKLGKEEDLKIIESVIIHQMYNKLLHQAKSFRRDGLEFVTEDLSIKEVSIIDYAKRISNEEIKVLVKAIMKEYIIDINNGKIVRGSNRKNYEKRIVMTFLKKNTNTKEGFIANCPNCGAESSQVKFGRCKYCDTLVFPIRYNWTLIKFETM